MTAAAALADTDGLDTTLSVRSRGVFVATARMGSRCGEQVSMVLARPLPPPTKHPYVERSFSPGTEVSIHFRFEHSRIKQYLKEGR